MQIKESSMEYSRCSCPLCISQAEQLATIFPIRRVPGRRVGLGSDAKNRVPGVAMFRPPTSRRPCSPPTTQRLGRKKKSGFSVPATFSPAPHTKIITTHRTDVHRTPSFLQPPTSHIPPWKVGMAPSKEVAIAGEKSVAKVDPDQVHFAPPSSCLVSQWRN